MSTKKITRTEGAQWREVSVGGLVRLRECRLAIVFIKASITKLSIIPAGWSRDAGICLRVTGG